MSVRQERMRRSREVRCFCAAVSAGSLRLEVGVKVDCGLWAGVGLAVVARGRWGVEEGSSGGWHDGTVCARVLGV